ncbi:MAG: aldo/keto reductase [Alphaproteobacteria bacterium]|nr:aldo/keto reductase [Alphaproteobacteria bacterium]
MKYRRLGGCGLDISAIGLGGMAMTSIYFPADEAETIATVHAALDAGLNFIDTSDAYAGGKNEEMFGRALKGGYRDKAVLATKFGNLGGRADGRPEYVIEACEKSLKRLDMDVIDVYFQHRVDKDVPIEDTVGAMAKLVEQGKVRYLGLSEAGPDTIRSAAAVHPICALQTEYSLWTRFVEDDILPLCRDLGIGFVAYSPLGRGMLTGAIAGFDSLAENDRRKDHPRFQQGNIEKNVKIVQPLNAIAKEKGCTTPQLALAWLLHQGDDIVPIPGTRQTRHVLENMAAADIALTRDEVDRIGAAVQPEAVSGTRYPEKQLDSLGI